MNTQSTTVQPALARSCWNEINTPGAYVDTETGDLYRIPQEALLPGASPVIHTTQKSLFARVSEDPNLLISEARRICADNDIQPGF